MTTPPDLPGLLRDAVDGIEPADRLDEIRSRVSDTPAGAARPWWYAAGGVVLATAATLTAFAVLGDGGGGGEHDHDDHVAASQAPLVVPVYFVGDTERGPRLFREYDEVTGSDPLDAALARMQSPASDPDYSTSWPAGSLDSASVDDGVIHVELGTVDVDMPEIGQQQLVHTLQAAVGERLPVHLSDGSELTARPQIRVLNHVMVNDPIEGLSVGDELVARGAAYSFEATVGWEIRDGDGRVVLEGSTTAEDSTRLSAWETRIDLADLAPGTYTFEARTDDATVEPPGPDTDTRTIIVR